MVSRAKRVSNHEAAHGCRPLEPSWFETRSALLTMRGLKSGPTLEEMRLSVRISA